MSSLDLTGASIQEHSGQGEWLGLAAAAAVRRRDHRGCATLQHPQMRNWHLGSLQQVPSQRFCATLPSLLQHLPWDGPHPCQPTCNMHGRCWCVAGGHATLPPAPSIALPNQDAEYVSHIALDIGGSLVKLIYFSPDPSSPPSDTSTPSQQQQQEQQGASGVPDTLAAAAAAAAATGTAAESAAVAGTTMHGTTDNPQTAVQARSSTDSAVEHVPRSFRRPGEGNGGGGGNGRGGREAQLGL